VAFPLQPGGDRLLGGGVRLALEDRAELGQLTVGQARKAAGEPRSRGHPAVDLLAREVVQQLHGHRAHARHRGDRNVCVGHHQVGEVRRAEVRRQPQPDGDVGAGHLDAGDEAEVGDRLVQLRIPHGGQRRPRGGTQRRGPFGRSSRG
jgi:hypothetical protein